MTTETVKRTEQFEDERSRGIAALAFRWDMDYKDAEKLVDEMNEKLESKEWLQSQIEAAMAAEFTC